MKYKIYGLREKGTDIIRYVGLTSCKLKKRIYNHIRCSKTNLNREYFYKKSFWLRDINFNVDIVELLCCIDKTEAKQQEDYFIKLLKENDLMNELQNGYIACEGKRSSGKKSAAKLSKVVFQYDLTGKFVKEWKSTMDAQREEGFNNSHICQSCKNGKPHKDYYWSRVKKED